MKKAIIHISDMHVADRYSADGKEVTSKSWFSDRFEEYYKQLRKYLKDFKAENEIEQLYFIVSGDLSNSSEVDEYKITKKNFDKLKSDFSLIPSHFLIVPGNHDINWYSNEGAHRKNRRDNPTSWQSKHPCDFLDEKYSEFKSFYDDFYNGDFQFTCDKAIVGKVVLEDEKIIIIGLNSTFKNSNLDKESKVLGHLGPQENLEMELSQLLTDYNGYSRLAVFHHNPETSQTGIKYGIDNWESYKRIFEENQIATFLYGHEHGVQGKIDNNFNYLASGSFGKKGVSNHFNILLIESSANKTTLTINYIHLVEDGNAKNLGVGYWSKTEKNGYAERFVLYEKGIDVEKSTPVGIFSSNNKIATHNATSSVKANVDDSIKEQLIKVIKEEDLYRSGHFHWSDDAKAHNWIDISLLLSKRKNLILVKNLILNRILENRIDCDLIIGLGIEGNIIASSISNILEKSYSYLPYSYRSVDHSHFELNLYKENANKVLFITDVVHGGSSIKKMFSQQAEFLNSASDIYIVSLFYTGGKGKINEDLLQDYFKDKIVKFYAVFDELNINSCECGEDFRETCLIYKERLGDIYEFYDSNQKPKTNILEK